MINNKHVAAAESAAAGPAGPVVAAAELAAVGTPATAAAAAGSCTCSCSRWDGCSAGCSTWTLARNCCWNNLWHSYLFIYTVMNITAVILITCLKVCKIVA